jgi:hypothetical protein
VSTGGNLFTNVKAADLKNKVSTIFILLSRTETCKDHVEFREMLSIKKDLSIQKNVVVKEGFNINNWVEEFYGMLARVQTDESRPPFTCTLPCNQRKDFTKKQWDVRVHNHYFLLHL